MQTSDENLITALKGAVHDVTLTTLPDITPSTRISEFGLDSVALMELIGILEETFSIRIADEEVASLNIVEDLLALIRSRIPEELPAGPQRTRTPVGPQSSDISRFPEVLRIEERLAELERAGLHPYFQVHQGTAANTSIVGGMTMVNFSSYNYLGFSGHPEVNAAAREAIDRYGTSVSASRLVSGERQVHRDLEQGIARHIGVEDAVVFVSGHATNVTTIGHLFDKEDLIVHDSLCHDSILQGIYLSGAKRRAFAHGNSSELEQILNEARHQYRRVLICSEGIFSMDGDVCDLPRLIEVKKRFGCNLLIDEAHSMGVLGPAGRGIAHHFPGVDPQDVDLWMGTLSKSFASCGGYIAGNGALIRYLKFTAPGFLYSVGMPAPNAAAALKALELMQRSPEIVERLRSRAKLLLDLLRESGVNTGLSIGAAVVPAITGDSMKAMLLSRNLAARKINVQPIIHPAVEESAARLRFFISATHTEDEIRFTAAALAEEIGRLQ